MNARIAVGRLIFTSIVAAAAGCTSGQRTSFATEKNPAESVDSLGLTQLATAPDVRRIWSLPDVQYDVRPSPDGRFVSLTDWNTGNLVLHDLAKNTQRSITDAPEGGASEYAESSIISPDGKSVAYGWFAHKSKRWELRIAGLSGTDSGKVRIAYTATDVKLASVQAWTPNGTEVIVEVVRRALTNQIVAVKTSGDGMRILRTLEWPHPRNIAVSPDGRWIAYDYPTTGADRDVYVTSLDGNVNKLVAHNRGDDVVMGWTGTDGRLLVASDVNGTPSVLSLSVVNGNVAGTPLLVRSNMWRTVPVGTAGNGTIFYSVLTGERDVYAAPIDPVTGAISSSGTSLSGGNQVGPYQAAAWSPDGQFIAFTAQRGRVIQPFAPEDVVIRSVTRGIVRRLSPRMSRILQLHWFMDGRAVLLFGVDDIGEYGIFRMDLEHASLKQLLRVGPGQPQPINLTFSRDGRQIVFTTRDSADFLINTMNAAGGPVTLLRRIKDGYPWGLALSPDGKNVAVATRKLQTQATSALIVAPLDAGPAREVYRSVPSERIASGLMWTPDGRNLLFGISASTSKGRVIDVRRLSLSDGSVVSTGLKLPGLRGMRLSPDGRTLIYGLDRLSMELWTMEQPVFAAVPSSTVAGR